MSRKGYPEEFKIEAVKKLVPLGGKGRGDPAIVKVVIWHKYWLRRKTVSILKAATGGYFYIYCGKARYIASVIFSATHS